MKTEDIVEIKCRRLFVKRHGEPMLPLQTKWETSNKVMEVYDPWRKLSERFRIKKKKHIKVMRPKTAVDRKAS